MNSYGRNRRGFSHTDCLTAMLLVALVGGMALGARSKAQEIASRVKCQSNLSQMGKGLLLYSNENKGAFPRVRAEPGAKIHYFTSPVDKDPKDTKDWANPLTSKNAPEKNDITAALFLLIRTQDMTTDAFVCPSVTDQMDKMDGKAATERMNFTAPNNLSYSFVNVYPSTTGIGKGYKTFITAFSSDFAVAADIGPGGEDMLKPKVGSPRAEMIKGNSPNHGQDGQNVLYADGHAEFQQTPLCGTQNDNIYTVNAVKDSNLALKGESVAGYDPAHPADSVLLIMASERPKGMEVKLSDEPIPGGDEPWRPAGGAAAPAGSPEQRIADLEKRVSELERRVGGAGSQKK